MKQLTSRCVIFLNYAANTNCELLAHICIYLCQYSDRVVVPGGAGGAMAPPDFLSDQLTLSQPGGADYPHHITTGTPGFLDLPTALHSTYLHTPGDKRSETKVRQTSVDTKDKAA